MFLEELNAFIQKINTDAEDILFKYELKMLNPKYML